MLTLWAKMVARTFMNYFLMQILWLDSLASRRVEGGLPAAEQLGGVLFAEPICTCSSGCEDEQNHPRGSSQRCADSVFQLRQHCYPFSSGGVCEDMEQVCELVLSIALSSRVFSPWIRFNYAFLFLSLVMYFERERDRAAQSLTWGLILRTMRSWP